jgi:hypothetical protein
MTNEPSATAGERTAAATTIERLCGTESEEGGLHAGKTTEKFRKIYFDRRVTLRYVKGSKL